MGPNVSTKAVAVNEPTLFLDSLMQQGASGIVAGTTQTQAGATQLNKDLNIVGTCATVGDGVALPKWYPGMKVTVVNRGAAALAVWPIAESTDVDTIDGGAAGAVGLVTVPAGGKVTYIADPATAYNWLSDVGAGRRKIIALTAVTTLTAASSGALITLGTAGGFTVTLPALAEGLEFEFFVKVAPTTAYYISSASAANVIYGVVASAEDAAGSVVCAAAADRIDFVANKAIIGDSVKVTCDGARWYVTGLCNVQDGIVLTQVA